MPEQNNNAESGFFPEPIAMSPEKLAKAYAKAKAKFSAADLQRFAVEEEGIPLDKVLAELEEIHRENAPRL